MKYVITDMLADIKKQQNVNNRIKQGLLKLEYVDIFSGVIKKTV